MSRSEKVIAALAAAVLTLTLTGCTKQIQYPSRAHASCVITDPGATPAATP